MRTSGVAGHGGVPPEWRGAVAAFMLFLAVFHVSQRVCAGENVVLPALHVFAGGRVSPIINLPGPIDGTSRLIWSLKVDHRSVAQGEVAGPAEARVPIPMDVPELNPGISMKGVLDLWLSDQDAKDMPIVRREVWIHAKDPLPDGGAATHFKEVRLINGDDSLREAFKLLHLEVKDVLRPEELLAVTNEFIVVGPESGRVSTRGLPALLLDMAMRGNVVVCLNGSLPMYDAADVKDWDGLRRVSMTDVAIVKTLDKRFDASDFADVSTNVVRWSVRTARGPFRVTPAEAGEGWAWIDAEFPEDGRMIWMGLPLPTLWERHPVARYAWKALLEYIERKDKS